MSRVGWLAALLLASAPSGHAQSGAALDLLQAAGSPGFFDGALGLAVSAASAPEPAPVPPAPGAPAPSAPVEARGGYEAIALGAPVKSAALDAAQRESLYKATAANKVASLDQLAKYDPTGIIGFCFGRAMAAHLLARLMGLGDDGLRKLFIVGDMRSGADPEWRFHVTALVRGTDLRWYAIDPVMDKPLELNDWVRSVRAIWDKPKKTRLYITGTSAVLPDVRVFPGPDQETGERIIELKFDPRTKPGFKAPDARFAVAADLQADIFELDAAAPAYFLDALAKGDSRFDFDKIVINGQEIGYNSYFRDLLLDLSGGKPSAAQLGLRSVRPRRVGLGSMRLPLPRP